MTFQLPFKSSHKFKDMFEFLDDNLDTYGMQSYGMSVTTLEEVFIKVGQGTHTLAAAEEGIKQNKIQSANARMNEIDLEGGAVGKSSFNRIDENDKMTTFYYHLRALITKRFLYFLRDTKAWIFQYVVSIFRFHLMSN